MAKVIWITGLSGSGKTTIADEIKKLIPDIAILDGDILRAGINNDLGFSTRDIRESARRTAEIAKIIYDSGRTVLVCLITPFDEMRLYARSLIPEKDFVLVHLNVPVEICEKRDVKGLYKRARAGEFLQFIGIHTPFEKPSKMELEFDTISNNPKEIAKEILDYCFPS